MTSGGRQNPRDRDCLGLPGMPRVAIPAQGSLTGAVIHCVISEVDDGAGSDEHERLRDEVHC